jgi:hypothetical protein
MALIAWCCTTTGATQASGGLVWWSPQLGVVSDPGRWSARSDPSARAWSLASCDDGARPDAWLCGAACLVTVETGNAMATSANDAALIRTSWTAASRRTASSPASQTKHSSPRMNARPPSSSCNNVATFPKGTAPEGVRGRGGWAVIKPIIPTPKPVEPLTLTVAGNGS